MRDFSTGSDFLSLNTATVRRRWDLRRCIEGCARHSIPAIAPWRDGVREMGLGEAARAIRDHGLRVSSLCRGGFFTDERGSPWNLDDNRRAVDEAAALEAACLILVVGGLHPLGREFRGGEKSVPADLHRAPDPTAGAVRSRISNDLVTARARVEEGLARLLEYARPAGVPLALEPLHPMYAADRACVNTLHHAFDLAERVGEGVGLAVDTYHLWWDPELPAQVARAGPANPILGFHAADWLVPTRDLLTDRGMPGDGVIDFRAIREPVEGAGFAGDVEFEIFSEGWWARDPDDVLDVIRRRYREVV